MKIVLFGGPTNRSTLFLKKLIALKQQVVVFYFNPDPHEKISHPLVQKVAKKNKTPAFLIENYNYKDYQKILNRYKPDLAFSVSWRYFIPKSVYSIPKKFIVFHDSLLPRYRGFAPMNWALINGEKETGVTAFYISDEIDAGDIVAQKKVKIDFLDDAQSLDRKITDVYLEILGKIISKFKKGKIRARKQNHRKATYTCKRIPADGKIDWKMPAKKIYDLIRGLADPYPGAFCFWQGKKIYIWKSSLIKNSPTYRGSIPGRVIKVHKNIGIEVLTGDKPLLIKEIQLEKNKEKIKADKLIKSIKDTLD